uniref:Lipoprotein n=1 Tax=Steinernema glaseri TaxID=37863 RepID=A0A1I7XZC6_9BILA
MLITTIISATVVHALTSSLAIVFTIVSCAKSPKQTSAADFKPALKVQGACEAVDVKELAKSRRDKDSANEPRKTKAEKKMIDTCPSTDLETLECFKEKDKKPPKKPPTVEGKKKTQEAKKSEDNVHGDVPKVVLSAELPVGGEKRINKGGGICVDKDGNALSTFAAPKY